MSNKLFLENFYGIFEENGELFIEDEVIDFVMDEYNLYEEDAIEMIMEAYEEELYNEAIDILIEDYGLTEDEAIDILAEEDDYIQSQWNSLPEADKARLTNAGHGALAGAALAGLGYGALKLKRRTGQNRDIRRAKRTHRQQMANIRKTGKRLNESTTSDYARNMAEPYMPKNSEHLTKGQRNAAYGAGLAVGALGTGALALYSTRRDKKRHLKRMDRLSRKYQRREDKAKQRYLVKHPVVQSPNPSDEVEGGDK